MSTTQTTNRAPPDGQDRAVLRRLYALLTLSRASLGQRADVLMRAAVDDVKAHLLATDGRLPSADDLGADASEWHAVFLGKGGNGTAKRRKPAPSLRLRLVPERHERVPK